MGSNVASATTCGLGGLLPCQRNESSLKALENDVESEMESFVRKRTSKFKCNISNKTNEQNSEHTAVVQDLRIQAI